MAYVDMKDFRRAISDYGLAIEYGPTDPVPLVERGKSYLQLGKVSLALADFDRAAALGSSSWGCDERAKLGIELDRARADCDAATREAFYSGNFADLLGPTLDRVRQPAPA